MIGDPVNVNVPVNVPGLYFFFVHVYVHGRVYGTKKCTANNLCGVLSSVVNLIEDRSLRYEV